MGKVFVTTLRAAVLALTLCQLMALEGLAAEAPAYLLGSGDKLRITVFDEKDLTGTFDVSDQGVISMPLIGSVNVKGRTVTEVQKEITDRLAKDFLVNPRVSVDVLNYRPFFILGEVKLPNSYPYVAGMTVLNAIALAGGYTPRASKDSIMIKRASDPAAGEQHIGENDEVLPGDIIRVPERFF